MSEPFPSSRGRYDEEEEEAYYSRREDYGRRPTRRRDEERWRPREPSRRGERYYYAERRPSAERRDPPERYSEAPRGREFRRSRSDDSASSRSSAQSLLDGFLSDSDDGNERAVAWMRQFGRRRREPPRAIQGDTLLEVVKSAIRAKARGKYGEWEDYLRFLHRHSKRCRPPPGRAPEQQTPFLLRNFLRSLHADDRVGDVQRAIDESSFYS